MKTSLAFIILFSFFVTSIMGPMPAYAGNELSLPAPGVMVHLSPDFIPFSLRGIKFDTQNPFRFQFIVDTGNEPVRNQDFNQKVQKLVRYFLASLTMPPAQLWVNLSPYEKNKVIPDDLALTEMGRDMLAQDYFLKQLTSSLIYPEEQIGREFWSKVYKRAAELYGSSQVPINTFNKVWIVADKAVVQEKNNAAYVAQSHLKVMLEQDYLSSTKHGLNSSTLDATHQMNSIGSQVVREVVIPLLNKEVNEGKSFAQLRQIYDALILATWYKKKIADSILKRTYVNQDKIKGIDLADKDAKNRIYQQYLKSFKKGVYNYIKEDVDPKSQQIIPRKYFSGGVTVDPTRIIEIEPYTVSPAMVGQARVVDVAMLTDQGGNILAEKRVAASILSKKPNPWINYARRLMLIPMLSVFLLGGQVQAQSISQISNVELGAKYTHANSYDEKLKILRTMILKGSLSEEEIKALGEKDFVYKPISSSPRRDYGYKRMDSYSYDVFSSGLDLTTVKALRFTFPTSQAGIKIAVRLLPMRSDPGKPIGLDRHIYEIQQDGTVVVPLSDFESILKPSELRNIYQISVHSGTHAWDLEITPGGSMAATFLKIEDDSRIDLKEQFYGTVVKAYMEMGTEQAEENLYRLQNEMDESIKNKFYADIFEYLTDKKSPYALQMAHQGYWFRQFRVHQGTYENMAAEAADLSRYKNIIVKIDPKFLNQFWHDGINKYIHEGEAGGSLNDFYYLYSDQETMDYIYQMHPGSAWMTEFKMNYMRTAYTNTHDLRYRAECIEMAKNVLKFSLPNAVSPYGFPPYIVGFNLELQENTVWSPAVLNVLDILDQLNAVEMTPLLKEGIMQKNTSKDITKAAKELLIKWGKYTPVRDFIMVHLTFLITVLMGFVAGFSYRHIGKWIDNKILKWATKNNNFGILNRYILRGRLVPKWLQTSIFRKFKVDPHTKLPVNTLSVLQSLPDLPKIPVSTMEALEELYNMQMGNVEAVELIIKTIEEIDVMNVDFDTKQHKHNFGHLKKNIWALGIPFAIKQEIKGHVDEFWADISPANYKQDLYLAVLFGKLVQQNPALGDIRYDDFLNFIKNTNDVELLTTDQKVMIKGFIQREIYKDGELTVQERRMIIRYALKLHDAIVSKFGDGDITMREITRFNIDFSRFYAKNRDLSKMFEYFVITAHNIYGRVIKTPDEENTFADVLKEVFGSSHSRREILHVMNYGDYENLNGDFDPQKVSSVQAKIDALINRNSYVHSALLMTVDDQTAPFVENSLRELAAKPNHEMVHLNISRFFKREELLGKYMPKKPLPFKELVRAFDGVRVTELQNALMDVLTITVEESQTLAAQMLRQPIDANDQWSDIRQLVAIRLLNPDQWREFMVWSDGVLVNMVKAAKQNPDKQFDLVFDNISAMPDQQRLILNPILWERILEIPNRGLKLEIPSNVNFILTMHQDTTIEDESFMNRPLVHRIQGITDADTRLLIRQQTGLDNDALDELMNIKDRIAGLQEGFRLTLNDCIEIARRVTGIAREGGHTQSQVLTAEAYNYIYLRLTNKNDRKLVRENIFGSENISSPKVKLDLSASEIDFDGVKLALSPQVLKKAALNPQADFKTFMLHVYGYIVTDLEVRVLCQLARALKYGNRVVQLQGPSGEGKTEVGRIFTRLVNFNLKEKTVNNDSDLGDYRGKIRPGRFGQYRFDEGEYVGEISTPHNVFLFNEINTNTQGLYYWLYPELMGRSVKSLPEYPQQEGDEIVKQARIEQNNLWIYTVNPEGFQGRDAVPPIVNEQLVIFHVASDPDSLPTTIAGLFEQAGLTGHAKRQRELKDIHLQLKEAQLEKRLESGQDITKRNLIWIVDLFKQFLKDGLAEDIAWRRAIELIYVISWKSLEDQELARNLVNKIVGGQSILSPQEALRLLLTKQQGPVMIFANAANDPESIVASVRESLPTDHLFRIPLTPFQGRRQLIGDLNPSLEKGAQSQIEEALGLIPQLIETARLNPNQPVVAILERYTHLNPQIAPLLNEFFQTGQVEGIDKLVNASLAKKLIERILEKPGLAENLLNESGLFKGSTLEKLSLSQQIEFARWFYGQSPNNLRIIAIDSSEEEGYISPAELNRFRAVNLAERLNSTWVGNYLDNHLTPHLESFGSFIRSLVLEVSAAYEQEQEKDVYPHNRLSKKDIDVLLNTLNEIPQLTQEHITRIVYYTLGLGLRTAVRNKLSFKAPVLEDGMVKYEQREDGIYLVVDGISIKTRFSQLPGAAVQQEFLSLTNNLFTQLAALVIGLKNHRMVLFEGFPGGGKTSSFEEIARRLGLPVYEEQMYEDIDLGNFIGRVSKEGRNFIITALKKDSNGHYLLPFLKAYTEGGVFLLDEGAIGVNSQEVISFIDALSRHDQFDLGFFHPGLQGIILKRHPQFYLGVAQNPHGITSGREPLFYTADTLAQKVWVHNVLSMEDIMMIIGYYANDSVPQNIKDQLAQIHAYLNVNHPKADEISPRQLIMVTKRIVEASKKSGDLSKALFEGVMLGYLTGLSDDEFKLLWEKILSITKGSLGPYLDKWKTAALIHRTERSTLVDDIAIPFSAPPSNIKDNEIEFNEDINSQNFTLHAIALGISMGRPLALLQEDGADAYDLLKKFANHTGYQLETLWSHPQVTRTHLLSSIMPRFEPVLDDYGIKRETASKEFMMGLGFLARYLVEEKEFEAMPKEGQQQILLFFNLMDAIPESQRVILNQILTTKYIDLIDEKGVRKRYVLPPWVHFIVSASVEHSFSSAFINRFTPIRIKAINEWSEVLSIVHKRYSLVTVDELRLIYRIVNRMQMHDFHGSFGTRYGFSWPDIFELARMIHVEKQQDIEQKQFIPNSWYYLVNAVYQIYGMALSPADTEKFENDILMDVLSKSEEGVKPETIKRIYDLIKIQVEGILEQIIQKPQQMKVRVSDLPEGTSRSLPNGMTIKRTSNGYFLSTLGANEYYLNDSELSHWVNLVPGTEDFQVKKDGDDLVMSLNLIDSIGGIELARDDFNRQMALPPSELPTREFTLLTSAVRRQMAVNLRAWQRIDDVNGFSHAPRVVMINGFTGTNKTTGIRSFAKMWGCPLYTLNSVSDLRISDMTVGLKISDGEFQVGVKEFLARVGKINGKHLTVPNKLTSGRTILLIDEANSSPEVTYALAPLFRGEKKFNVEYAGESFEVEIDQDVMVVLTFNPAETHSGRGYFPREMMTKARKIWSINPLEYTQEELIDILDEYHRRGVANKGVDIRTENPVIQEGYQPVTAYSIQVQPLRAPAVESLLDISKTVEAGEQSRALSRRNTKPKKDLNLSYDLDSVRKNALSFDPQTQDHQYLLNKIISGFLLAWSNGYRDESLKTIVLEAIAKLDPPLAVSIQQITDTISQKKVSKKLLIEQLKQLKKSMIAQKIYVFTYVINKENRWFLLVNAQPISAQPSLTSADLTKLGENSLLYEQEAVQAIVTQSEAVPSEKLGYFDGNYALVLRNLIESPLVSKFGMSTDIFVEWVAYHEMGHLVDQQRLRVREIVAPPNSTWTQLAQAVNKQQKELWLSENLELNAMLFPAIFLSSAKEYISRYLRTIISIKDPQDYYVQAVKGILNGVLIFHGKRRQKLISNAFEDELIGQALKIVDDMSSRDINAMTLKFYRQPKVYLATAEKGFYRTGADLDIDSMGDGADGSPEVDSASDQEHNVDAPKPEGEQGSMQNDDDRSKASGEQGGNTKEDEQGKPSENDDSKSKDTQEKGADTQEGAQGDPSENDNHGLKGGTKGETPIVLEPKRIDLMPADPVLINRFLKVFAGEVRHMRISREEGETPNIERVMAGDMEPFDEKKEVDNLGSLTIDMTMDVSGSTKGKMHDNFYSMFKVLSELFFGATMKNIRMSFGLSAIGDEFESILNFSDSRNKSTVEKNVGSFKKVSAWTGGIDTVALINGVRAKYKDHKYKPNKMEIVFTDGGETSGVKFAKLREMLDALEKELDIDIVFIGVGSDAKEVQNYSKFLYFKHIPSDRDLIESVIKIALAKTDKGRLPKGDLGTSVLKRATQDKAELTKGGIDLNTDKMDFQIQGSSGTISAIFDKNDMSRVHIDGLVPVVVSSRPLRNISEFFTDGSLVSFK